MPWLPPLWQVIYQEGIRGNHLIFSLNDIQKFESNKELKSMSIADLYDDHLEESILRLLCCTDVSGLIQTIESHSDAQKAKLYFLYLHALRVSRKYHKDSLN